MKEILYPTKEPRNRRILLGLGKDCPKCGLPMRRLSHYIKPEFKSYYFTEWDHCKDCNHVQLYDEFKSQIWKEEENGDSLFRNL